MRDELEALIAELDLQEHISLAGKMTQDGIAEMYRIAAVFALPCLVIDDGDRDGIPNVLIEAMAQRLAVVSTDVSSISELVEPANNGLLVPEKNADALADALALLLAQPALRKQMGDRAREKVIGHFSLMSSATEVWATFQEEARAAEPIRSVAQQDETSSATRGSTVVHGAIQQHQMTPCCLTPAPIRQVRTPRRAS